MGKGDGVDCKIGKTRWWPKDKAHQLVFGYFNKPDGCLFIEVMGTLAAIISDTTTESNV